MSLVSLPWNILLGGDMHAGCWVIFIFEVLFLCGLFKKSSLNILQYCFCFIYFWPWDMWDLSSPTRDWTRTPCIGRWSPSHWTTREIQVIFAVVVWEVECPLRNDMWTAVKEAVLGRGRRWVCMLQHQGLCWAPGGWTTVQSCLQ